MLKRSLVVLALALVLPCVLSSAAAAMPLGFAKIGAGIYGVSNTPISLDNIDASSSSLFGVRGRFKLMSLFAFEPSYNRLAGSDPLPAINNVTLGFTAGSLVYAAAGIGWSSWDVEGGGSTTKTSYMLGGGAEIGAGPVSVDVSPRFFFMNDPAGENYTNLAIMAGINYYFF
jgi:hypothetical protein